MSSALPSASTNAADDDHRRPPSPPSYTSLPAGGALRQRRAERPAARSLQFTDVLGRYAESTGDSDDSGDDADERSVRQRGARVDVGREQSLDEKKPLLDAVAPRYGNGDDSTSSITIDSSVDGGDELRSSAGSTRGGTSIPGRGTGVAKTMLLIFKAFIGTGILFLPNGFVAGGLATAIVTMMFTAVVSTVGILLLVRCRQVVDADADDPTHCSSFSQIGERAYGVWMKRAVQLSLVMSQCGFCTAYLVFMAQNLQSVTQAFADEHSRAATLDLRVWVVAPVALLLPMCWVRRVSTFSVPSMCANVVIVFSLLVGYVFFVKQLAAQHGLAPSVTQFGGLSFMQFFGTAVYSFEGIGLVLPIESAMAEPHKFPRVCVATLAFVTFLYLSFGAMGYAAYGACVRAVVFLSLATESKIKQVVQIAYVVGIIFTFPLMLYPATKIIETYVWTEADYAPPPTFADTDDVDVEGASRARLVAAASASATAAHQRRALRRKWGKNALRSFVVLVLTAVAVGTVSQLDHLVALIGGLFCMPLAFTFPAVFHYRLVATTRTQRIVDASVAAFGVFVQLFCTGITVWAWVDPGATDHCEKPPVPTLPPSPSPHHTNSTNTTTTTSTTTTMATTTTSAASVATTLAPELFAAGTTAPSSLSLPAWTTATTTTQ